MVITIILPARGFSICTRNHNASHTHTHPTPHLHSLAKQQSVLEGEIGQLETEISSMESRLGGLLPSLEELRRATLPLQESLGVTIDKDREERELALLLPR